MWKNVERMQTNVKSPRKNHEKTAIKNREEMTPKMTTKKAEKYGALCTNVVAPWVDEFSRKGKHLMATDPLIGENNVLW